MENEYVKIVKKITRVLEENDITIAGIKNLVILNTPEDADFIHTDTYAAVNIDIILPVIK